MPTVSQPQLTELLRHLRQDAEQLYQFHHFGRLPRPQQSVVSRLRQFEVSVPDWTELERELAATHDPHF